MKKILIGLLTFLLGVYVFNLFDFRKAATMYEPVAPVQTVVEISKPRFEYHSSEKIVNSESFFNSFKADESFYGWFITDNFRGMKEVWAISLNRDDENSANGNLNWRAGVRTWHADGTPNDDDNFQAVWIKNENNRFAFRTNKIRGVEYKFDGEFFKNGKEFSDDEKVLKGTLRKIIKGKEVAKLATDFAYQEPHCLN